MEGIKNSDNFERQFRKREMIDVGEGGIAEVVDVPPIESTNKSPVLLDPSTLVPINVYKHVIHGFVKAGRRTLSINHPRTGGSTELPQEDRDIATRFSAEQIRQALTDVKVLDAKQIENATMIGHSQRGVSSALAALLMARRAKRQQGEQRIKNVVLFESAGLVKNDSRLRLATGFISEPSTRGVWGESFDAIRPSEHEIARRAAVDTDRTEKGLEPLFHPEYEPITETEADKEGGQMVRSEQLSQYSANPMRALKEMWGLAATDLLPVLKELRESGVGVIVITGASDTVFPIERIAGTMNEKTREITPGSLTSEHVDMFLPFRGDHALRVPQVSYIDGWLSVLEDKQKRARETTE